MNYEQRLNNGNVDNDVQMETAAHHVTVQAGYDGKRFVCTEPAFSVLPTSAALPGTLGPTVTESTVYMIVS